MTLRGLLPGLLAGLVVVSASACSPETADIETEPNAPAASADPAAAPAPMSDQTPDPVEALTEQLTIGDVAPSETQLVAEITGDLDARVHPDFGKVPAGLASREGMYGRKEALDALTRMSAAAKADGINLVVVSAFRSFRDQTRIWNDKWTGATLVEGGALPQTIPDPVERARKILEYSSMPATSRHHWGTDFDLNNLNNDWFDTGEGARVYDWLVANAASFGFCQVYSRKGPERPAGYEMEKWHWSYMPLAADFLTAYPTQVGYARLTGFEGADVAREIGVIENYVESVNPACTAMR